NPKPPKQNQKPKKKKEKQHRPPKKKRLKKRPKKKRLLKQRKKKQKLRQRPVRWQHNTANWTGPISPAKKLISPSSKSPKKRKTPNPTIKKTKKEKDAV